MLVLLEVRSKAEISLLSCGVRRVGPCVLSVVRPNGRKAKRKQRRGSKHLYMTKSKRC